MRHQKLIQTLTTAQKAALLSGKDIWSTYPVPELGIPSMFLADGPHGVRKQLGPSDHLGLHSSQPATCFPTAAGMANSWNLDLAREVGHAIGEEAACQQVNVLLGPGLNIKRDPLGGRNFEYYSEDPYLSGKMAAASIRGIQENGISACPKHFAANSQELLRMVSDSVVDMRALRELYLTNFEIAVKEGHPKAIMSSYNRINGTYANDNVWLLTDVLRKEWGFDGFVVTDWGGSNDHAQSVRAGGNLEMPGTGGDSDHEIIAALQSGSLSSEELDQRVDELLDVILSTHPATASGPREFDADAHHALARKAAAETVVLLKNEGDILPLSSGTHVAVIGDMAIEPRFQGAGSSLVCPTRLDRPIDCLNSCDLVIVGQAQGYRRDGKADRLLLNQAVETARKADVVLLYLGLSERSESESMDRQHMRLPANQTELLTAVSQVNPSVVVVLSAGGAIEMPWLSQCKALLHGYLPGQAGAGAVVDLITGVTTPSGKLSESFPLVYTDAPSHAWFPGQQRTAEYRESIFVGYRYYETVGKEVRFPFGFGLSYTTFHYSNLKVSREHVSFTLTNTGSRFGGEVAQVYLSAVSSAVFRPIRELKGFSKVFLSPGESRRVTIPLDDKAFRYFNIQTNSWEIEEGEYLVQVGASVQDLRLTDSLFIAGTGAPSPYDPSVLPSYFSGKVDSVSDQEFETLLGHPLPESQWNRDAPLEWNDALLRLPDAKNPLARLIGRLLVQKMNRCMAGRSSDLSTLFIGNMPFRGIAKMTGGPANEQVARSVLLVANGHFFRGFWGIIRGLWAHKKLKKERHGGI